MSQTSRTERRRNARGGATPPKRRDPMIAVYVAFGVIIVLVLAGFGIARWRTDSALKSAVAFDNATPAAAPGPTPKPIQLKILQSVGKRFVFTDPKQGKLPDTQVGGSGQNIDGLPCETAEQVQVHFHAHLSLFVNGVQMQIPPYVGFAFRPGGGCLYWIHTHDPSGVIHIEAGGASAPSGGPYTLGDFFDIWGQPLNRSQIGPFKGSVAAFLNLQPYAGDLAAIPLQSHQIITLEVGTPVAPPPNYKVPVGE